MNIIIFLMLGKNKNGRDNTKRGEKLYFHCEPIMRMGWGGVVRLSINRFFLSLCKLWSDQLWSDGLIYLCLRYIGLRKRISITHQVI